jgi:hypothetical protein
MNLAQEYRKHAHECREMARLTQDLESRAGWGRLAERWLRCADLEEARRAPARHPDTTRPRKRPIYRRAS